MKISVLLIIAILLLSGCGIFNLDGFVLPDDLEFMAVVESLDTPEKISDYMEENFSYEHHNFEALSPYELWKTKKGDCNDCSCFGIWVANYHGYETYQIEMFLDGIYTHYLGVYIEEGKYSFTSNFSFHGGFNSFREIVEFVGVYIPKWKSYKVYDYWNNVIETGKKI